MGHLLVWFCSHPPAETSRLKIAAATVLTLAASLQPGSYPAQQGVRTEFSPVPTSAGFAELTEKTGRMVAVELLFETGCSQKVSLQEGAMGALTLSGKQEFQFIVGSDGRGGASIVPQTKRYRTEDGHTSILETIEPSPETERSRKAMQQAGVARVWVANVRDMNEDEQRERAARQQKGAKPKLAIECGNKNGSGCKVVAPSVCERPVCGGLHSRYYSSGVNCSGASCGICHS